MKSICLKIAGLFIAIVASLFISDVSFGKSNSQTCKQNNFVSLYESAPALNLTQFMALEAAGAVILDTRLAHEFASAYIPKSIHIGWEGPFKVWVSKILVDKNQPLIVVGNDLSIGHVLSTLRELGYSQVLGYLAGGVQVYKQQYITDSIAEIDAKAFLDLSTQGQIIDVRSKKEYTAGHIDNAMNFPLEDLGNFKTDLRDNKRFYVQCLSGYRSMIAISILKAKGVENVINIQGGYQALKKIKEEK